MMDMQKRAALIEELQARGFRPAASRNDGWGFIHEDGFCVHFNSGGKFIFTQSNGPTRSIAQHGVMIQPFDLLHLIDEVTKAL